MVAFYTTQRVCKGVNGENRLQSMTLEAGSSDCRKLIEAKRSLEDVLKIVSELPHADHIKKQLLSVHGQFEGMHDLKRVKKS